MDVHPDLPFIFVSGTLGEEVAIEALKVEATDYDIMQNIGLLTRRLRREANVLIQPGKQAILVCGKIVLPAPIRRWNGAIAQHARNDGAGFAASGHALAVGVGAARFFVQCSDDCR